MCLPVTVVNCPERRSTTQEIRGGGLALTRAGLRERDRRVFAAALSAGVPVAVTLAGGYASSPADTVSIHVGTVLAGADVHARARDGLPASRH